MAPRFWPVLSVLLAWCLPVEAEAAGDKLAKTVLLRLGTTTLEKVTAALSEQTGLRVEVSDYLRERRLIVQMEGLSARAALDSLAELYEWEWREWKPDHILLMRRDTPLPREVAQIPPAVQSALSREFRRFLGIGMTLEEYATFTDPQLQKEVDFARRRSLFPEREVSFYVLPRKMQTVVRQSGLWLFERLRPRLLSGNRLRFTDLASEEQERLVAALTYKILARLHLRYDVLNNRLAPGVADITRLEITYSQRGHGLSVGATILKDNKRVFIGGGVGLDPEPGEAKPSGPENPENNR
jgi:hypothetical protein